MRLAATLLLAWLSATAACTALDPQVGASQEACGIAPISIASGPTAASGSTSAYGGNGAGPVTVATPSPRSCSADAGSTCDDCESQFCCTSRLACYSDPVCTCFDNALDDCLDAAGSDPGNQVSCWKAFDHGGTVEAARVACELAWCRTACAIPAGYPVVTN